MLEDCTVQVHAEFIGDILVPGFALAYPRKGVLLDHLSVLFQGFNCWHYVLFFIVLLKRDAFLSPDF